MSIVRPQGRAKETTEAKMVEADNGEMLGLQPADPKRKHVKNSSFREWEKGGPGDGGYKPNFVTPRGSVRSSV